MLHRSSDKARSTQGVYYQVRNRYWFMRRFATRAQQIRYLPSMFLHDLFYGIEKRAPDQLLRAWRDGLSPLPASLRPPLHSTEPDFIAQVHKVGATFGLGPLLRRIQKRMGGQV